MTVSQPIDDCLFQLVANGDEVAFERLFNGYKNHVYAIALFITRSVEEAEEIVLDVFQGVWKNRTKLVDIIDFKAWLTTVARNRSLSVIKKVATERMKTAPVERLAHKSVEGSTDDRLELRELESLIHEAMGQLTPRQKKIFELSRIQGLDRNLIAHTLGLSPATVSAHLTLALKSVRAFLCDHHYNSLFLVVFLYAL